MLCTRAGQSRLEVEFENTFDVDSFRASLGKCICKLLLHCTRLDLWPAIKSAFRLKLDGKMAKWQVNMAKAK